MSRIKDKLLHNWHIMRLLRTGIGLWALGEAIYTHDWAISLLAVFFLYQGITDTGCCGSAACYTPRVKKAEVREETVSYEEIK